MKTNRIMLILVFVALLGGCHSTAPDKHADAPTVGDVISSWKTKQLEIREVQDQGAQQWLKASWRDGDELWAFSSPQATPQNSREKQGLAIFRNGKLVTATFNGQN